MQITSGFKVKNADLIFETVADVLFNNQPTSSVTFSGTTGIEISASIPEYGRADFQGIIAFGGDIPAGYGSSDSRLQAFTSEGLGGLYVPPEPQYGDSSFHGFQSVGHIITSNFGDGDADFSAMISIGGEGAYGMGDVSFPAITSDGWQGLGNITAPINSFVDTELSVDVIYEQIVFINSDGTIIDTITNIREVIAEILDNLSGVDTYTTLGSFTVSLDGDITTHDHLVPAIGANASLNDSARIWVVNIDSGASSQYDNYGYNSFITRDGIAYGFADDGIYRLDGDDDTGSYIESLVEIGRTNLGSTQLKTIPEVYIGISSTDKMYLRIDADGNSYTYEARSSSEELKTHRVDPGKGLRGTYYNFTLLNKEGCDFDLESISFVPIQSARKI